MTLLVFGKTGQVARELARLRPDALFLGRDAVDLTDPAACAAAIAEHGPALVINAAAYTAVDKAETDQAVAMAVNGTAPGAMATACAAIGAAFVHISTDYVFDGTGTTAFVPSDPVAPLGAYGHSKATGEAAVTAAGGRYAILRTSWVFSAHGTNFVKTMLRLSQTRDHLTVVADQVGGPTPAADIAQACLVIGEKLQSDPSAAGIFHLSGAPDTSWASFARTIFDLAGRAVTVEDIPSSAYPTPARRPANSRLDCTSLETTFTLPRPDWQAGLRRVLQELEGSP